MRIVDANVLLYAVNSGAHQHEESRRWLEEALGGADTVGFTWNVSLAFLRVSTHAGVFPRPLSVEEAVETLAAWHTSPAGLTVEPGPGHARILSELLLARGTGGNLVPDAHLAALALETRSEIVSFDADFSRFAGIRARTPGQVLATYR
ncbi:MAG TPA: type II toxin-antitoxin system VapC family toxin [Actinomycetales bacterium]|nr:type II toxin-antitoxin system VapC family toxin [Actinomycetales bacterium]